MRHIAFSFGKFRDRRKRLAVRRRWQLQILGGSNKRLIRHWYAVNDEPLKNEFEVKFAELKNAVQGRASSSSVIVIGTRFFDDVEAARATLDEFYAEVFAESYDLPE